MGTGVGCVSTGMVDVNGVVCSDSVTSECEMTVAVTVRVEAVSSHEGRCGIGCISNDRRTFAKSRLIFCAVPRNKSSRPKMNMKEAALDARCIKRAIEGLPLRWSTDGINWNRSWITKHSLRE